MAIKVPLASLKQDAEYVLAKYNFVLTHFPDCVLQKSYDGFLSKNPVFVSKTVNQVYTHLTFLRDSHNVTVIPHCKLEFEHNGKSETITIHSSPKRSLLAKIALVRDPDTKSYTRDKSGKHVRVIKFSRLSINLKNNNFDDKMLNECRANIMAFIKENSSYKLDQKHLEPRLKKLLVFT